MFESRLGLNGVTAKIQPYRFSITSQRPLKVLSSAVVNGGQVSAHSILNYQVSRSFNDPHPQAYLERLIERLRLPKPVVGLMTAVDVRNLSIGRTRGNKPRIVAIVTAGLSYPVAAGDVVKIRRMRPGTINTIVLVDGTLTDSAMVDAVKTTTEAKSIMLRKLDVKSRYSKEIASGTSTDSICVASTADKPLVKYAGTGTPVGQAIACSVRAAVEESIRKEEGMTRDRSLINRLSERGIILDQLLETGMALFVPSGSESKACVLLRFRQGLLEALSDVNVASLILAAFRLDEDGAEECFPANLNESFRTDSVRLVADEAIGFAIANYIAGTNGLHNFLYYDRFKPGLLKNLPPFADDAIGGLVAGVMSKILRPSS